ncbi:MAG: gliding motility-associated C-terminal domain-containing protein [Brumimicrobium sp.]
MKIIFTLIALFFFGNLARATHGMGGEITWTCQGGGDYVFELIFYRDCNGFEVNTNTEEIRVWGHPSVTDISVDFIERIDISPECTAAGGEVPLDCGSGANGGNGVGAVEKIVYRSNPITLSGTPPSSGWFFTYENFSRSGSLTNISSPTSYGITISAAMYPIPDATGGCIDNSPRFLQDPYVVSCAGEEYKYNPHATDTDLDSLVFDWGVPLDHFPTGVYNPPTNPAPVPFEPGFSYDNPTPDATFNAGNVPASIDSENGAINFTSNTQGNFATKVKVDAYRGGVKIATVERETQLVVLNCTGSNTPPVITPPFAGGTSFETTIFAGDAVNFDLIATDNENLQDGNPQSNTITTSGLMYGTSFTDATGGCDITPCATLDNTPPITNTNGATVEFDWQTSCDHLVDASGQAQNSVPYTFVFKVQDDYCQVPQVTYATVTINVENKDVLPPTKITCITTDQNDDVTVNWDEVNDPSGDFENYELFSVSGGSIATFNNINTTSHTIPGAGLTENEYFISVNSGCDGNTARYSDTVSNIVLDLNNPGNGEAQLQWNQPADPALAYFDGYFHIYREYPTGTWTLIDSVEYSSTNYTDTITICDAFLNYQIVLPTSDCDFESNIIGDDFEDQIVPDIPVIASTSIDTTDNGVNIEWSENAQQDTYGYVIYQTDQNGNLVEIDTVWGIGSTSYTHYPDITDGPLEYSIAAFDSCFTDNVPPTHQTSAKAEPHSTNFLTSGLNICDREINMNWTGYVGFNNDQTHNIYAKINGSSWQLLGDTESNSFTNDIELGDEFIFVVETVNKSNGNTSFSNIDTLLFTDAGGPTYSYLSVASVENETIEIRHRLSLDGGINRIKLWRFNDSSNDYEEIDEKEITNNNEVVFIDNEAEFNRRSYRYQTEIIDTCDKSLGFSNIGETMFLQVITDEENMVHTLQWTPYSEYIGNLKEYRVYRAINGEFDPNPIATVPPTERSIVDSVEYFADYDDGEICYFVQAAEGSNEHDLSEFSHSNTVCPVIPPTIYIPNAFTVGGKNPVFKPETRQHQFTNYHFEIFDRYGRTIFKTNDPNVGWKGRIQGSSSIAREGVYVYRLSLRDGNGIEVLKHGHVTLLDYRGVE